MMMASEEGPAISGMAMGTMKGSSCPDAWAADVSISLAGEYHSQSHEEQQDSAGNIQGGRFQAEQVQQEFPGEKEQ